jgi:hypothetical protein
MNQDDSLKLQMDAQIAKEQSALAHAAAMDAIVAKDLAERKKLQETYTKDSKTLGDAQAEYAKQSGMMMAGAMAGSLSDIFGQFAAVGEEATAAQKLAFVAQKSLAIAQILLYTHVAAARAPADAGTFLGMTLANTILAQGYASAGLVAGLSIGQMASGNTSSSSAETYDTGGTIPYNRVGIVGEYGPELVQGPAHVTGRGATSSKLGGSNVYDITLAPVIHVTTDGSGGGSGGDPEKSAKMVAEAVRGTVMATLQDQMRPGGVIDTFVKRA